MFALLTLIHLNIWSASYIVPSYFCSIPFSESLSKELHICFYYKSIRIQPHTQFLFKAAGVSNIRLVCQVRP